MYTALACTMCTKFLVFLQVHWVQQQHEKRRAKRDYPDPSFPAFGDYPSFFGTGSQDQQHQPQYRGISPHNVFPDPLFKEQWYLVSTVIITVVIAISMPTENIPPEPISFVI